MKRLIIALSFIICQLTFGVAQSVTRTQHRTAIAQDAVSTGTMTIKKPDYICISTNQGKEQLIMEGTKFTMTVGGKKHVTDSRKNEQFATFHQVLKAVINNQPIPKSNDVTITTKNRLKTINITPAKKKKRQMFTSFELVVDDNTSAIRHIRMNERGDNYTSYEVK
jgi:hypothetical protein